MGGPSTAGWQAAEGLLAIDADVAAEFPGLRLPYAVISGLRLDRPRSPLLSERLATAAERLTGPMIRELRASAEGTAYRAFYRQVGLDPDRTRPPVEALVAERVMRGGFVEGPTWRDALVVASVTGGVALQAFDARRLADPPAVTLSADQRLVLSAGGDRVADLLGEPARRYRPGPSTRRLLVVATAVPGISEATARAAIDEAAGLLVAGVRA